MHFSYSQLEWFLRCPYIYKYQYIDKNVIPRGKSAAFGGLLHNCLEYLYNSRPLIPTLSEMLHYYEAQWERKQLSSQYSTDVEAQVYFKEGLRILKDYYEQNNPEQARVFALEKFFQVPLKDSKTKETHILTGRIDRIDKTPRGIEVIDYKTSKALKTQRQVKNDLQLSLYHLGLSHLWPDIVKANQKHITVSLYFLRHRQKISTRKSPEELKETQRTILGYIRQIQEAIKKNEFEPQPSGLCAIEPYNRICPFFKDQFREKKPKIEGNKQVSSVIKEYTTLKGKEKEVKGRIKELNELIQSYLDEQKLEGIFSSKTGILRSRSPVYDINVPALEKILKPLGKWEEVLEVSKAKLKKLKNELSLEEQEQVDSTQTKKGESKSLRVKRL